MSEEKSTTTATNDLSKRMQVVQDNLSDLERKLNRSNKTSLIVSILLLALLAGYFGFGYWQIASIMEPKQMVSLVMGMLEEKAPEVRMALQEQVEENAEEWARTLSEESLKAMPAIRGELEDYAMKQTGEIVDEVVKISKKQFEKIIKDNKPTLQAGFAELAMSEHLSEKSFRELEDALEAALQKDMKEQAAAVLDTLVSLNSKLSNLQKGDANLDKEGKLERGILMKAKALQIQEALGKSASKGSGPAPSIAPSSETDEPTPGTGSNKESETTKPDTETTKPDTETKKPDTETKKPDTETKKPDTETKKPDTDEKDKTTTESKKDSETEKKKTDKGATDS